MRSREVLFDFNKNAEISRTVLACVCVCGTVDRNMQIRTLRFCRGFLEIKRGLMDRLSALHCAPSHYNFYVLINGSM